MLQIRKLNKSTGFWFSALILSQGLHSFEEVKFELWKHFEPARKLSAIFSEDLSTGFLLANLVVVLVGALSVVASLLLKKDRARIVIYFWIIVESINFAVHTVNSILSGGYFPGLYTAPLLIFCSIGLFVVLQKGKHQSL